LLAAVDAGGDGEIQVEELFEEVGGGPVACASGSDGEAVGVKGSGVEGGAGLLERVSAGEFEGAVEGNIGAILGVRAIWLIHCRPVSSDVWLRTLRMPYRGD